MDFTETSTTQSITLIENGRTLTSDIIVGIAMMILSATCAAAYSVILKTIWKDTELIAMASYKFMIMLGIFDVAQCLPHFVSGLFTIFQTTFNPVFARCMGAIASSCYLSYSVTTVILSIQRLFQILSPRLDRMMFSGHAVKIWICFGISVCLFFAVIRLQPDSPLLYLPEWYSWDYDHTNPLAKKVQEFIMIIEMSTILLSMVNYIFVVFLLVRKRKRFMSSANYTAEIKIFIQASVITVYISLMNFLWNNYSLTLPDELWSFTILNFMWILNSGIYPVIYFVVNKAIRERVVRHKKTNNLPTATVNTNKVTMISKTGSLDRSRIA